MTETQEATFSQTRYFCERIARLLAIQVIAQDRRVADSVVAANRRQDERRKQIQVGVQRDAKWGW